MAPELGRISTPSQSFARVPLALVRLRSHAMWPRCARSPLPLASRNGRRSSVWCARGASASKEPPAEGLKGDGGCSAERKWLRRPSNSRQIPRPPLRAHAGRAANRGAPHRPGANQRAANKTPRAPRVDQYAGGARRLQPNTAPRI